MEWISVKDEFPETCLNVLVFLQEGNRKGTSIAYFLDGKWWGGIYQGENEPSLEVFDDDYRFYLPSCYVTHWQILPETPKENKEKSCKIAKASRISNDEFYFLKIKP